METDGQSGMIRFPSSASKPCPEVVAQDQRRVDLAGVSDIPSVHPARAIWTLLVISLVCFANYYDRNLLAILAQAIKRDLLLSDSEFGLLSGLVFALVYSIAALPLARVADRHSRVGVLGCALAIWSLASAACGAATSYVGLAVARLVVGLGEAGGLPTSHAIVAQQFTTRTRARALSAVALASGMGAVASTLIGGKVAQHFGWRIAFFGGGAFGLLLVPILLCTVRDNRSVFSADQNRRDIDFFSASRTLLGRSSFVLLCLGIGVASIGVFAIQAWTPAYLMRLFHLDAGSLSGSYAAVSGPATLLGILVGGLLGDWLQGRGSRWLFWLLALSFTLSVPVTIIFLSARSLEGAIAAAGPMLFVTMFYTGPAYALVQQLAGPRLRATGAAIFLMVANIVGLGIGPALTGWLSDLLHGAHPETSLQMALRFMSLSYPFGALILLAGARTAAKDIRIAAEDIS